MDTKTWRPQPRAYETHAKTQLVPDFKAVPGETLPRRHVETKDKLVVIPELGIHTVHDILKLGARKYGNARAVGRRRLIKTHEEVKKIKRNEDGQVKEIEKKWTYSELGPYEYLSFIQFEKLAIAIGAGLKALGLVPRDDRLHIYAGTSLSWQAMAHGAASQAMPVVTTYDTLGEEGLKHAIVQTKPKAIFVDPWMLKSLMRPLKESSIIENVLYSSEREVDQADIAELKATLGDKINIMSFDELRSLGESSPQETCPPTSDDISCIMYTSGSTGTPKGVVLKHRNVVSAIAGVNVIIGKYLGPSDQFLTYLPLAHIIEFVFENAVILWGGTMGYGTPRTLTDTAVKNCKGDFTEFRPTVVAGVPFIWESVRKGIISKIEKSNVIVRSLFWSAYKLKETMMWTNEWLPGAGMLDSIVFKKVKEATGGRLRVCMNGGGPIADDTRRFISNVICPMVLGYGLTETACMGALTDPASYTEGSIGPIPGSIEIKLVDTPEFGYFSTNASPQGEIWIRGAAVADGYLDNEEETREAFTADGWFKTGDIGEFDTAGNLKIIDRKKNLIKTLNGEYIALEKLESKYSTNPLVSSMCVSASADQQKPVAILVSAEQPMRDLAAEHGIDSDGTLESLRSNKDLRKIALRLIQQTGRETGLASFEIIHGIIVAQEDWTPQNGFKTSAQKLNRRGIVDKYRDEIAEAYRS